MFTGLIAEMGRVDALRREGSSYRLTIEAKKIPLTLFVGESVCCNGACLTVTHFDAHCFTVDKSIDSPAFCPGNHNAVSSFHCGKGCFYLGQVNIH